MSPDSLKKSITRALVLVNVPGENDQEKRVNSVLIGLLTYKIIETMNTNMSGYSNNIESLVKTYCNSYSDIVGNFKNKYASYQLIEDYIEKKSLFSILTCSTEDINEIYTLYQDKTLIEVFSIHRFSQSMYNIVGLSMSQYNELSKYHYDIFVPIAKHYMNVYGVKPEDITLVCNNGDIEDGNPQREILMKINNIPGSKIIADIKTAVINVGRYIYSLKLAEPYVYFILK